MVAPIVIAAGIQVLGSIFGSRSRKRASKKQQRLAEQNAALQRVLSGFDVEAAGIAAGAQIAEGILVQAAFRTEAGLTDMNAAIALQEQAEQAEATFENNSRFIAQQKVNFLKSGVDLSGSPLVVIQESREQSLAEVQSILDRADAQFRVSGLRSKQLRSKGKAQLLSSRFVAKTTKTNALIRQFETGIRTTADSSAAKLRRRSADTAFLFDTATAVGGFFSDISRES